MAAQGGRASHNTFMTMLVDHGVIGGAFYIAMLIWIYLTVRAIYRRVRGSYRFIACALPAIAAVFAAQTVGDMFVQHSRFEARIWFLALLSVILHFSKTQPQPGAVEAAS